MPSDTYILTISEAGVSVPSSHASTHLTGGSDAIPVATSSTSGLMSAAIFNQHTANTAKVSNVTHTGDVTDAAGVLTVNKINGVSMSGLATGIVKNTTSTGAPSIAVAADFPTLNQNTTGNAATATSLAGGSAGSVPYQSGAGTTAMLSAGTAGYVLKSNGSSPPSWEPVSLTSGLSGSLPVSSGGTGAVTLTGIIKGNGTSPFSTVAAPAGDLVGTTDAQTLTNKTLGSGTTIGVLGTPSSGTLTNCTSLPIDSGTTGTLPVSRGGSGATTLTGIIKGNGTSAFTTITTPVGDLVGTTDTQTLTNKTLGSGTTISALGTPASGALTNCTDLPINSGTTGTLSVTKGGTGSATFAAGVLKANGTANFTTVPSPVGDLVGTTDTQTLTNKTLGAGTAFGSAISVANGGTGAITFTAGILTASGTNAFTTVTAPAGVIVGTTDTQTLTNKTLTSPTITGATVTGGSIASLTTPLPVLSGGTGTTTSTGTGATVRATSPTLVIPNLGVPSSGTLTNCTGLSLTTGVTGILPVANGGTGYGSTGIEILTFDTTPNTVPTLAEGQLRWNTTDKTLDLKMAGTSVTQQIGEELLMRVHGTESAANGRIVYISGSNAGLPAISLASNDSIIARKTLGIATESITSGSDGYITLMGLVRGLDLAAYTAGQELYLSTSGSITGTEPLYPAHKVRIGYVVNATDGTGSLFFAPKFYENGIVNGSGKIGYDSGSGGTVTQTTNKSTGVTLNKTNGQITMNNAALAGGSSVSFTLTNSKIEAGDVLILNHIGGGILGDYALNARSASGSASISISNITNSSHSDAVVIAFAVIKAVTA